MKSQGADKAAEVVGVCAPFAPTPKTPWEMSTTLGGGSSLITWASRLASLWGSPLGTDCEARGKLAP